MASRRQTVIRRLLESSEPSVRWKARVRVLGEDPSSSRCTALERKVAASPRVRTLLHRRDRAGRLLTARDVYDKWQGAHWVLAALADLAYPPGDPSLCPLRDQVYDHWLAPSFFREFDAPRKEDAYRHDGVPVMDGRPRRCASQQGNALYFLHALGIADARSERLAERLRHWQWPDGGWNCDKNPTASHSSFTESLLPMVGLAEYATATGDSAARSSARRAQEVFLTRKLFRRRSDGAPIHPEFLRLHYPLYWHYDLLGGLKAMARLGTVRTAPCREALDLLEAKELAEGGWASEKRYYSVRPDSFALHADYVDWGPTGRRAMNEWVTVDALAVLAAAGRGPE